MSVNSVVKHSVMPKDMYLAKMWKSEKVYIGEKEYDMVISPAARKNGAIQYHIGALSEGNVVTFQDLNQSLYEVTVQKYIDELNARLASLINQHVRWVNTGNHDIYVSYGTLEQWVEGTSLKTTGIRIILMVKNVENLPDEEEVLLRKLMKGELVEWMESVLNDKPAITRTKDDYAHDIVKIMDTSMIPHTDPTFNSLPIMTIIAMVACGLALINLKLIIAQIISMVISAYAAYRAYKKDEKPYLYVNLGILAISIYLIYYGSSIQ